MSEPVLAQPQRLDESRPPSGARYNGGSVAAFLAAGVSLVALGLVVVATELHEGAKNAVFDLGKAIIPHADHIGPYSGKEVVAFVAWVVSWPLLHLALRHRQVNVRAAFFPFLAMLILAAFLIWPPVWHFLEGG